MQYANFHFSKVIGAVIRDETIFLYGDGSSKPNDADRFITQFSHRSHTHTQNIKHIYLSQIYLYQGVYLYYLGMCGSK